MTESAKQAWSEVGDKFSSFGRRVADRYREAGTDDAAESEASQRELQRAAKDLIDELSRGFSAIGATIRDEDAKRDLGDAVSAIGDAITATVNEASEGIRSGRTGSTGDSAEGSARSSGAGGTDSPEGRDDR
ncbi:MAG: hypothetical protein ACAH81_00630 [Actinomycetota bacterium]